MGKRFKFQCACGQRLVAEERMAGFQIRCPACGGAMLVPPGGQAVNEKAYRETERYVLACTCQYRMLVKAETANHTLYCPMCQSRIRVPSLDVLRKGTARVLVVKTSAEDRIKTEQLLLLVDDEGGPGREIS